MNSKATLASLILVGSFSLTLHGWQDADALIDFDRQIKPILSDRCYACHGPDGQHREADLRLDRRDDALAVITPGDSEDSELVHRLLSDDPYEVMPPEDSGLSLTDEEKQLVQKWIDQGATWKRHWAFEPVKNHSPPQVVNDSLIANPVDRFILARLERDGLTLSPLAVKERLIRRVTFDLTGLPPTLDEIDAFLADDSVDAWEKLIDRLLASEQFGHRMASDWLDVARYSDTYGYQVDRDRFVWPWRDWVIRSFNENKPYDQFLTEQIAGDLLPEATDDQILATTFNRLHPQKVEGGSVEEEFRVEYVADRIQTVGTAFLGLTLECARCHDHKFDPISQKEYYQLFSFFNNIDEAGLYSFFTNSVPTPTLRLQDEAQKRQLERLNDEVDKLVEQHASIQVATQAEFAKWLDDLRQNATTSEILSGSSAPVEIVDFESIETGRNERITAEDGRVALRLTGDDEVGLKSGNFTRFQPFTVTCSINTPDDMDRAVIFHRSRAWTDAGSRGYQLLIEDGRLSASLIHFWPGNAIRVRTRDPIPTGQWLDVAMVYSGIPTAGNLGLFVNGQRQEVEVIRDNLTRNITGGGRDHLAIGARFRDRGFRDGMISSMSVYDRQLSELEILALHHSRAMGSLIADIQDSGSLSDRQTGLLRQHFDLNKSTKYSDYAKQRQAAIQSLAEAQDKRREIMVMREMATPRKAWVLGRGAYDNRLEEVTAGTPEVFPPLAAGLPVNRLGLAEWLIDPAHPLTGRVAVNHLWQMIFGEGLVRTPEDFGRQGASPTHPELLDWLSRDFVDNGWNVKRMVKQLVMSRTYRQSSDVTDALLQRDPENELLARFPSHRLPAENVARQRAGGKWIAGQQDRWSSGPALRVDSIVQAFTCRQGRRAVPSQRLHLLETDRSCSGHDDAGRRQARCLSGQARKDVDSPAVAGPAEWPSVCRGLAGSCLPAGSAARVGGGRGDRQ